MNFEFNPLPEDSDTILVELHSELEAVTGDFETSAAAIQADHNQSPVQRSRALDASKRDAFTEIDEINKTLRMELQGFAKRIRELLRIQPVSGDSLQRYQEARSVLRAAANAKRKTIMQNAIKTKDRLLLQAVIDGPSYLSGLTAEEHSAFAERAHDALYGVETRELEHAESLANRLVKNVEKARAYINSFGKEDLANAV